MNVVTIGGVGLFVGRLLTLVFLTALLSEAAARTGAGLLPLIHRRSAKGSAAGAGLERFGLGLLLGWAALGFTYLGLALAGLFTPLVLAGCALALLCSSHAMWERRLLLVEAATESRTLGIFGLGVLALGMVPTLMYLLMPEGNHDVWVYHLGVPWQYLQAGRAVLEYGGTGSHIPLTFEMAFALPLIAGDDRLAKGMVISCFVGASMVFAAHCLRRGRPTVAWLGPLLALSSGAMLLLMPMCKSDVPASAMFIAGVTMQLAGVWGLGAFLLGLCVAMKLVYGPIVLVWCLCFLPPRRRLVWCLTLLVLPILPWFIKNWLAIDNPFFPAATNVIPTFNWAQPNWEVTKFFLMRNLPDGIPTLSQLPAAWFNYLRKEHLLVLLSLPGLLLISRHRRSAWACVVAHMLLLAATHIDRYLLPAIWLLYLLIAEEAIRFSPRLKAVAAGVLAIYAILRVGLAPQTGGLQWVNLSAPWSQVMARQLTTFLDMENILAPPGTPGVSWRPRAPRPPRVLSVGEWRTYKFPARLIYNGMRGETPLVWKLVKESQDLPELSRKFRQLGARRLLYNYVTVEWASLAYGPFPWDRRMLRLYVDFCKQHLTILGRTERCDFLNGGFYIYEIRRKSLKSPPATVWFAPGTETMYGPGTGFENQFRKQEALEEHLKTLELLPDVGHAWNHVGHAYALLNDPPNAFHYLNKFGEEGMMDSMNLAELGAYAVRVGKLDLGERVLADAFQRYPSQRNQILINQATWNGQKAVLEFNKQKVEAAEKYVKQGLEIMEAVPENLGPANEPARRTTLAFLIGMKGEVCFVRGDRAMAAKWFAQAAQLAPEVPMAPRWKTLSAVLGPRLFNRGAR